MVGIMDDGPCRELAGLFDGRKSFGLVILLFLVAGGNQFRWGGILGPPSSLSGTQSLHMHFSAN